MIPLSHERLLELLAYDAETGVFTRNGRVVGVTAHHGYKRIMLDCVRYHTSHLAWYYSYGKWPDGIVDHINRDRGDNRLVNLREATRAQNNANTAMRKDNNSGIRGVRFKPQRKKWEARLGAGGKYLGLFASLDEAVAAYNDAARCKYGEFATLNSTGEW